MILTPGPLSGPLVLCTAALMGTAAAARTPWLSSHATLELSQARSDLGAAVADGAAIFAGGCSAGSTGGGKLGGGCKDPSGVVDILRPSATSPGLSWEAESSTTQLSAARGWPAVCSFGPAQEWIAVLGGGDPSPNAALDLISIKTGFILSNASSMPSGRWGTSCAAAQDGSQVVFGGGKHYAVRPPMADEVYVTGPPNPNGNPFWRPSLTLAGKLSEPREDCGAVGYGSTGALFAGGWVSNTEPGNPSIAVDAFNFDGASGSPTHSAWKPGLTKPSAQQEWVGAVAWNETTVFLADSTTLYEVNSADTFSGTEQALRHPLPPAVAAAAGIPSARIQQNGVRIPGAVCFYASAPNSVLLCWSPLTSEWQTLPCTETHVAGAIAVADNVVFVGGGFGTDQQTVHATVDVFTFGRPTV